MKKVIRITLLFSALVACKGQPNSLSPAAYARYLETSDNGMRRTIETGNIIYNVQLATPEYVASKEFGQQDEGNSKAFNKRLDELKGSLFFMISIQTKDKQHTALNTDEMAIYFEGAVINDLILHTDHGDLKPAICHFENNLGLSPKNTLVTAFLIPDGVSSDLQLQFNDRFYSNPMVNAEFSIASVKSLPKLNLN